MRNARRMLVALGHQPFEPTAEQRRMVSLLAFNGTPEARIASALKLTPLELRYWFADELGYAQDRILAQAAANILELASQRVDLAVALRANEAMLRSRLKSWREPKATEDLPPPASRVSTLSLAEVERELARIDQDPAAAAGQGPPDPPA